MDPAILERELLQLPAGQRALLADALLASLDEEAVRQVESLWALEADRRLEAYRRGEAEALDGPTLLQKLRDNLGG